MKLENKFKMSVGSGLITTTSNNNMYRVGDYVYFENSGSGPFAIRRIEELNKSTNGEIHYSQYLVLISEMQTLNDLLNTNF